MKKDLTQKKCTPCTVGAVALTGDELKPFELQLSEGWSVVDKHHLEKTYTFKNFKQALAFTNVIGAVAEEEGHHPTILLSWGQVVVRIWTHKVDGLTESDFILAAKIEVEYISHIG